VEAHLELDDSEFISDDDPAAVAGYNRDDCLSTRALRDSLEHCRRSLIAEGVDIPRPEAPLFGARLGQQRRTPSGSSARTGAKDRDDGLARRR
jgi:hypothetical protein